MKRQQGSILVFTLWILIILTILGLIVSYHSSNDVKLAKYESDNIKALYLAKAGLMKMLIDLGKDTNNYDSLNEDWNRAEDNPKEFKFGGGTVFYGASDERTKLNLNSSGLKKEYLVRLGIDDSISQNIIDYRANKSGKGFEFIEELFLVEGMTKEIYLILKDYVTIYKAADAKININTAGERVLEAILDDTISVSKILEYRVGNDGKPGTEDDGIFRDDNFSSVFEGFGFNIDSITNLNNLFTVRSDLFRIWMKVSVRGNDKIVKTVTAIADRTGKIYLWKED